MRFNRRLLATALSCCAVGAAYGAEEALSAEFWQWYSRYVDEQGDVFDPLDLAEVTELDEATAQSKSETDTANADSNSKQDHDQTDKAKVNTSP